MHLTQVINWKLKNETFMSCLEMHLPSCGPYLLPLGLTFFLPLLHQSLGLDGMTQILYSWLSFQQTLVTTLCTTHYKKNLLGFVRRLGG